MLGLFAFSGLLGAAIATAMLPKTVAALASTVNQLVFWVAGAITWLFVAVVVGDVVKERLDRRDEQRGQPMIGLTTRLATILGAGVLVTALVIGGSPTRDKGSASYGAVATFGTVVRDTCKSNSGPVVITSDYASSIATLPGVVALARLDGCSVHVDDWEIYAPSYKISGDEPITFMIATTPIDDTHRLIATWDPNDPPSRWRAFDTPGFGEPTSRQYLYQQNH